MNDPIRNKLISKGISRDQIILCYLFGFLSHFNYTYYKQWQILNNPNFKFDFFITGISYFKLGMDLMTMQPWRGVNLARNSQDLYFSYKMVEAYIKNAKSSLKFCFIGFSPYSFNYWLDKTNQSIDNQIYYMPILNHNNMEYHGSKRGNFVETIFKSNYKIWLNNHLNMIKNQPFNLNDIDGARKWHQENCTITLRDCLNVADEVGIYKRKIYPETIEQNKIILKNYIELCRQNDVVPIGLLLPFSPLGHKHYPKNSLQNFFDTLQPFLKDMNFINLWDLKLPDSCFEDITHLNIRGSVEVTKIIKEQVSKILSK